MASSFGLMATINHPPPQKSFPGETSEYIDAGRRARGLMASLYHEQARLIGQAFQCDADNVLPCSRGSEAINQGGEHQFCRYRTQSNERAKVSPGKLLHGAQGGLPSPEVLAAGKEEGRLHLGFAKGNIVCHVTQKAAETGIFDQKSKRQKIHMIQKDRDEIGGVGGAAHPPHQKPPFIGNPHRITASQLVDAGLALRVKSELIDFALRVLSSIPAEDEVDLPTVMSMTDVAESTIRRWLNELAESGILETDKVVRQTATTRKKVRVYSFCHPTAERIAKAKEREKQAIARTAPLGTAMAVTKDIDPTTNMALYINMMMSALFPALSYSQRDKTESRSVKIKTEWGQTLPVTVKGRRDVPVPRLTDLVAWTGILSLCYDDLRDRLALGKEPQNLFVMKAFQVARFLKVTRVDYLTSILHRLNGCEVELSQLPGELLDRWGLDRSIVRVGFIHDLSEHWTKGESSDDEMNHKAFLWSLPNHVYQVLLAKIRQAEESGRGGKVKLFALSPSLLEENNNVVLALHLYCRRALPQPNMKRKMTLKELHETIAPTLEFFDFAKKLASGIQHLYEHEVQSPLPARCRINPETGEAERYEPIEPSGHEKRRKHSVLPWEANVECYGFIVILNGDEVFLERNPYDPTIGMTSRASKGVLVKKADSGSGRPTKVTDISQIDLDF